MFVFLEHAGEQCTIALRKYLCYFSRANRHEESGKQSKKLFCNNEFRLFVVVFTIPKTCLHNVSVVHVRQHIQAAGTWPTFMIEGIRQIT